MKSFLHNLRLSFGVLVLSAAFIWDLGHNAGQRSVIDRNPASVQSEGCTQSMQALLYEGREYLPKGESLKKKSPTTKTK